jgi:hypothetical protein
MRVRSILLVAASLTLVLACGGAHPDAKSPTTAGSSSASVDPLAASADAMAAGIPLDGKAESRTLGSAQPIPSGSGGGIVSGTGK